MSGDSEKEKFLYPYETYRGKFQIEEVAFNANLQEFAQKISFLCNLETNGKLTSQEAYREIKSLWKQLKNSRKGLELPED